LSTVEVVLGILSALLVGLIMMIFRWFRDDIKKLTERVGNLETDVSGMKESIRGLREIIMAFIKPEIDRIKGRFAKTNPLTEEEKKKLAYYLDKIKRDAPLTRKEAEEFKMIAQKVKSENPGDPLAMLLAGLAGFLHGLIIAGIISEAMREESIRDY